MYRLIVSELAHQDLDNIVSYIAIKLANPMAARDFLNEVDSCCYYEYSRLYNHLPITGDFFMPIFKG
ncbi:hypothetical protein MAMMFC1_03265 [Methylomusa anaerophila]|uniref:Plasmid stabilisation system protein n=1 Tax=Methylomusa anaerophila TaxID=1930071 RepID=A0A348ANC2_9FIRM|nr:hypothetical protein MAMMFC1_03265 [Methylomusa anaerophila]